MRALVAYTKEDEATVLASRDRVQPHIETLVDRVYARLLAEPETAAYLVDHDGHADRPSRAGSLRAWLVATLANPLDTGAATELAAIGRAHTRRGGSMPLSIKGRYMLVMSAILQEEMATMLAATTPRDDWLRAITSWNKLMLIHLDIFLAVFSGGEANPHWY
jgi:hypothetical protein